jgi:hypothetical protein
MVFSFLLSIKWRLEVRNFHREGDVLTSSLALFVWRGRPRPRFEIHSRSFRHERLRPEGGRTTRTY